MLRRIGIAVLVVLMSPILLLGAIVFGPVFLFMRYKAMKRRKGADTKDGLSKSESMYPLW